MTSTKRCVFYDEKSFDWVKKTFNGKNANLGN